MEQTAVEWLFEKIKENIDAEDGSMYMNWLHDSTLKQAKILEKSQIIRARLSIDNSIHVNDALESANEYYHKTFK